MEQLSRLASTLLVFCSFLMQFVNVFFWTVPPHLLFIHLEEVIGIFDALSVVSYWF